MDTVKVDPRLRGDDEGRMPAKASQGERESIADTEKVDPRLRGDDEGWMVFAGMHARLMDTPSIRHRSVLDAAAV